MSDKKSGKVGIIVGGGPAPGINGVISAATIEAVNQGMEVIGFMDGFKWLAERDADEWLAEPNADHVKRLTIDDVSGIHLRGGSILRTSRKNPTKDEKEMRNVLKVLRLLEVNSLIAIGGDDTAFTASQVYARAEGSLRVAHVPKTIDNDLPLPGSTPTFGFETARHYGTMLLRNLAEDAKTTSRWYLVVSMGRAAGHLALGIGKAGAATLTIIPEEFKGRQLTLELLCDVIGGAIIKRRIQGAHYGVVVLAEGLIEAIGEEELTRVLGERLNRYGALRRDEFGHLKLGEIEFGRLVIDVLSERLKELQVSTRFIYKVLGYELRCADPIPFDAEYTRDLGYGAVKYLRSDAAGRTGAVISFDEGAMKPLPFDELINPVTKRFPTRFVDVHGETWECACRYMIRLEKGDFENPSQLAKLAGECGLTPEKFRARFGKVVGL
jgi:6-phosphofructokinase 1